MMTDFNDVMVISTAIESTPESMIIKARFHLNPDFKESSFEFQRLMMEQIYLAFGEMLEQVTQKAEWEANIEQLMYEDETIEEFQERTKDDPEVQKIYADIDNSSGAAKRRGKMH